MPNKKIRIILISLLTAILVFFIVRSVVIHALISKVVAKLDKYHLQLTIDDYSFKGIKSIEFQKILINYQKGDTIFYSEKLFFQLRLSSLFSHQLRLRKLHADNTFLKLNNTEIDSFLKSKNPDSTNTESPSMSDFAGKCDYFFGLLFSYIPNEVIIKQCKFDYKRNSIGYTLVCSDFLLQENKYNGNLFFFDSALNSGCIIEGEINRKARQFDAIIKGLNNHVVEIPFIDRRWGLKLLFDSLKTGIYQMENSSEHFRFGGFFEANNISFTHKSLAPSPVSASKGSFSFTTTAGDNFIEIDSTSSVTINKFSFSPYLRYEKQNSGMLTLKILPKEFDAQSMIESFPTGLFTSIRDMKLKGKMCYSLNFKIDCSNLDSVRLNSTLSSNDLQILKYGEMPLSLINDTFQYVVYEDGDSVTSILTGPENPNFVQLGDIYDYLKYSILTSEDGSFFYHKGFNEEAIAKSISENIKKRRFARGGSTITMQLVKNVFLNRNKTVSRKLEELLIVWMIENLHLVSKERMLEVYLNIIEWGPGIYGIKPAAEYYFKKKPSQLSLAQSIYLASIIPMPKHFKYTFTKEGKLKSFYSEYFKQLSSIMLSRNQLVASDTIGLLPEIELTGRAKDLLNKPDTFSVDSLILGSPMLIDE
jgi:hypothetical protein